MKTKYEQIVNVANIGRRSKIDLNEIFSMAEQEILLPAQYDTPKRLLLCIDVQNDFIEGGNLAVNGSVGDVKRITRFIYNNMNGISSIMCSLDTNVPQQIFHPCWWANSFGEHPTPYTIITYDDLRANRWHPVIGELKETAQYLSKIERSGNGKKKLCIWPYHCISGTEGCNLENEFAKMVYFHSMARRSQPIMVPKGTDPYSEMYGILKPEYSRKRIFNTKVALAIERYDEIYIAGEAASHCLLESVKQIGEHFKLHPEVTRKITILSDCTSPISGFKSSTIEAFNNFQRFYGMNIAKSTSIHF